MPPSPLTVTLIQSTILNAISNILAQLIDQHKTSKPFTLNPTALLQFVTYGILIVPPNFNWQRYIETQFPGFPSWKTNNNAAPIAADIDILPMKEKLLTPKPKPRSGMWNFAMKFFLDQTVAGVVNILLFIVLINLLKGKGAGRVWELVCEDFGPIMIARLKFRPVVSALMYTVVPVDRRVVFGSACGVIWGVYLSLYAVV
ncbi:uncharacterized protein BDW43DRAFT_316440 [Aspergillus alliaceus]|uniref:uncharacterized protein n=1 Tax=Petromyces alliaceus TaxID=209559 RepID=UPI0012A48348|nr:uncharacterized protein BDW43DRAFT_316440 [Aspergillus alliaceus]KAB8227836.1 hypothetical protein BDW43DRAFT_316440 [Aspergillus alliaceus]